MGLPLLPLGYYSTVIFQNWHCQRQARELEGLLTRSQLGIPPFLITSWPCMKMLHIEISWCLWTCHRFTVMDILSSHLQDALCFFNPTNFCSLFIPIALVHMPAPNKQWLGTKNPSEQLQFLSGTLNSKFSFSQVPVQLQDFSLLIPMILSFWLLLYCYSSLWFIP